MAKIRGWKRITPKKWEQGSWHSVEVKGKRGKPPHKASGHWRAEARMNGKLVWRSKVHKTMVGARSEAIEYMKKRSI